MPLRSWSLCCLWHHRPQHLNHSSFISVPYPWLRSLLVVSTYLSSHFFRVKCDNNLSSLHTSSCNVPQGSVLGPLFFIMYTTPLNTPISSLSLDHHHLCRWHSALLLVPPTQLWLKHFAPSKHSSTDLFLNDCLTPLGLNSCSSDSKMYLPKYTTLHLTPLILPEILASSLTNILSSLTK